MVVLTEYLHLPLNSDIATELTSASFLYAFPLARLFEFTFGMVCYVYWSDYLKHIKITRLGASFLEIMVLIILFVWEGNFFVIINAVAASGSALHSWLFSVGSCVMFGILICTMANGQGMVGRFLSTNAMVFLGEISYAIYMLHQVLIKIFVNHAPSMSNELTLLLYIIALFSLCSAAFLFVEKPLRSWIVERINRFNRRASQSQYKIVLIALCIIAILFPIVTSKDFTEFKLLAGTAIFDHEDLKIVKSNNLLF